mmetsp:Transcript_26716/g.58083  ORF Transcript_26716/g.58083 Transcript_26716/m.58083 type:complete len:522 (+) Transcript_26716:108-1673(+)
MVEPKSKQARQDVILSGSELSTFVRTAVDAVEAIDVHTHLFPGQHGALLLWGIDELLTYHYLVSEMFMVAPSEVTHEAFFALPKTKQADLVWKHLFLERSPLSEAQVGVLTCLQKLGLGNLVATKDLSKIRAWFAEQDPLKHTSKVFELANLKYVVMTNIPFDAQEADCWVKPGAKIDESSSSFSEDDKIIQQSFCESRFKTALRIDPLLKGDWATIANSLRARGLPETIEGTKAFLRAWAKVYKAEYMMASTPGDFVYGDADEPRQEGWPTATKLINEAMVPVAEELGLPLALKLGAKRGMNPGLNPCGGGDGVMIADVAPLEELCRNCPRVKFLATFLSRVNQHEVCVLAQKFRNLHLYGCWWYCNNPSIIEEMTKMRVEMLGTAFTAQHSDARVLDQLVYKWSHSRAVIAEVLVKQYQLLQSKGWPVTKSDVQRDVNRLFGGSYEEFMAKDLSGVSDPKNGVVPSSAASAAGVAAAAPPPPGIAAADMPKRRNNKAFKALCRDFARYCAPGTAGCGCC